jgi:predicted MPP superfamily phosphohydrolase
MCRMVELLGSRFVRTTRAPRASERRRLRIGVIALSGLTLLGLLLAMWGFLIESGLLIVRHARIETAKWPAALPPLRIAAVADIHAGAPHVDAAKLDRMVAEVNAQNPDVVLLLGDYVIQRVLFGTPMPPETIAGHLAGLRAKHGVFAVLGNHDWYDDGKRVWRAFESAGISVLENSAVPLPGRRQDLAGRHRRRLDATSRSGRNLSTLSRGGRCRGANARPCRLSGHTGAGRPDDGRSHTWGQVSIPFWGALFIPGRSPLRYAHGRVTENGNDLYVTSGIGTTALPVRFNVPPEIAVITLSAPSP